MVVGRILVFILTLAGFVVVLFAGRPSLHSWRTFFATRNVNLRDWGAQLVNTGLMLSVTLDFLPGIRGDGTVLGNAIALVGVAWIIYSTAVLVAPFLRETAARGLLRPLNWLTYGVGIIALAANVALWR